MSVKKALHLLLSVVVLGAVLIGCGEKEQSGALEPAPPQNGESESTVNDQGDSPATPQMGTIGSNLSLPEGFPGEIPMPADYNIINVRDNVEAKAIGLVYLSPESVEDLYQLYKPAFSEIYTESKEDAKVVLMGYIAGYDVWVFIDRDNNQTSVGLEVNLNR